MQLKEFSKRIAAETGIANYKVKECISILEREMRKEMIFGSEINILRVGKFTLQIRKEKTLNDISTGKKVKYPKHYKLYFKVTPALQRRIREKTVF
jgi:nucleoid DNA-binding protein